MDRAIENALVESLNDPNAGWVYNEFTAKNERIKCKIWLANGLTFLEVKFWGDKIAPQATKLDPITFGGDAFILGPLTPWRRRVYRAARAQQVASLFKAPVVASATIVAAIRSASMQVEASA